MHNEGFSETVEPVFLKRNGAKSQRIGTYGQACDTTKIITDITDSFLFRELDFHLTEVFEPKALV